MVSVSLRDKSGPKRPAGAPARSPARLRRPPRSDWQKPGLYLALAVFGVIAVAWAFGIAIRSYHDEVALADKSMDASPASFVIGGEIVTIPANMLRYGWARSGGTAESIELLLTWPGLQGFTEETTDAFRDGSALAPLIHVTIATRNNPIDSDGRLSSVYAGFFAGDAVEGPSGLIGRYMTEDSGYRSEQIFYARSGTGPFTARCMAEATTEVPATCIRDVNVGTSLSMNYRFNRFFLGDWAAMDRELKALAASFLADR